MKDQNFFTSAIIALSVGFLLAGCSGDLSSDAESGNAKDDSSAGGDSHIVSRNIDDSNLVDDAAQMGQDAVAVSCSGAGCDGKDPVDSGCAASAVNVGSQETRKGTFYLRYSRTCKTNWVHVGNYAGGSSARDGKLNLTIDEITRNKTVRFLASPTPGAHYGNMVYSPGSNCAYGLAAWNEGEWDMVIASSGCEALTANGTSMSSPLSETAQSTDR